MEVKGFRELEKALLELSDEFGPKAGVQAMRPAVRAAVRPIEATIAANTPQDFGSLANSTRARIGKPNRAMLRSDHFHSDMIIAARVGWTWSSKRSLWNQALAMEFGNTKVSGSSTLRNAFDLHRDQMIKDFAGTLGPAILKKAKALNKKKNKG
ncbi:MAG: hypothetical protein II336_15260 [Loktanella sp.]|nr:hypothetical protein [Loktanella sp.]